MRFLKKNTIKSNLLQKGTVPFLCLCLLLSCAHAATLTKVTLILDWFANPNHAPIFVAEQEGFFEKNGLDVKIIEPAEPSDSAKLVADKQADIGVTYGPQYDQQLREGLPLRKIGDLITTPLNCLIVLENGPIHTIQDLKGKRIGYSTTATSAPHQMIDMMLKFNGLSENDVMLINVHYGLVQGLLTGRIDGFTGGMRNFEPIEMELAGHPARVFYPEKNGMPTYSELIFITNKDNANKPYIQPFLKSIQEGTVFLKKHPEISWNKFANNHPNSNNELNRRAWFATLNFF
jgi:putative hydroxymethylpyrimidine transport system substrate-binding protein